jgi:hypothetical protein
MHVGIFLSITQSTIRIDELTREVEARGFESLWVSEHTHVPVRRRLPLPEYHRAPGGVMSCRRMSARSLIPSSRPWPPP